MGDAAHLHTALWIFVILGGWNLISMLARLHYRDPDPFAYSWTIVLAAIAALLLLQGA